MTKLFNNPDRVIEQGNRTRYEKDFGRDIGTDGQRTNVLVVQMTQIKLLLLILLIKQTL